MPGTCSVQTGSPAPRSQQPAPTAVKVSNATEPSPALTPSTRDSVKLPDCEPLSPFPQQTYSPKNALIKARLRRGGQRRPAGSPQPGSAGGGGGLMKAHFALFYGAGSLGSSGSPLRGPLVGPIIHHSSTLASAPRVLAEKWATCAPSAGGTGQRAFGHHKLPDDPPYPGVSLFSRHYPKGLPTGQPVHWRGP